MNAVGGVKTAVDEIQARTEGSGSTRPSMRPSRPADVDSWGSLNCSASRSFNRKAHQDRGEKVPAKITLWVRQAQTRNPIAETSKRLRLDRPLHPRRCHSLPNPDFHCASAYFGCISLPCMSGDTAEELRRSFQIQSSSSPQVHRSLQESGDRCSLRFQPLKE